MITERDIVDLYHSEVRRACGKFKLEQWQHHPSGILFTDRKSVHGLANRWGKITINRWFIGLDIWEKLQQTMRHEIAHLIVGLRQHHNRNWRSAFESLGGMVDAQAAAEQLVKIYDTIKYKYTLMGTLANGERLVMGQCHRRDMKKVRAKGGYSINIDGVRCDIVSFDYVVNV